MTTNLTYAQCYTHQNRPIQRQIHPMILARRSLREMNGQPVKDEELMSLFEAAKFAPSHYNTQTVSTINSCTLSLFLMIWLSHFSGDSFTVNATVKAGMTTWMRSSQETGSGPRMRAFLWWFCQRSSTRTRVKKKRLPRTALTRAQLGWQWRSKELREIW